MDGLRIERIAFPYTLPRPNPHCSAGRREKSVNAPDDLEQTGSSGKREQHSPYLMDDTAVRISYDKEIGRIVVQVMDERSATVLQQLPSEEMVAFLKRFRNTVALLVDMTA